MIDQQDLAHRRRFVYHGLNGHLPEESVRTALRLCDEEFARDPAFSLVKFLDRLTLADQRAAELRPMLFVSLQRARLKPMHELGADPRPTTPAAPQPRSTTPAPMQRSSPAAVAVQGWHDLGNLLLADLFESLRRVHSSLPTTAARHLERNLNEAAFSPATFAAIEDWLKTGTPVFTARATRNELHTIVHTLYLWMCDALGPVEADRLVSRAVRDVEKHPSSVRLSAHALL